MDGKGCVPCPCIATKTIGFVGEVEGKREPSYTVGEDVS
jgi:hypothetical protein